MITDTIQLDILLTGDTRDCFFEHVFYMRAELKNILRKYAQVIKFAAVNVTNCHAIFQEIFHYLIFHQWACDGSANKSSFPLYTRLFKGSLFLTQKSAKPSRLPFCANWVQLYRGSFSAFKGQWKIREYRMLWTVYVYSGRYTQQSHFIKLNVPVAE